MYSNLLAQNTFHVEREDELKGPGFPFETPSTNLQTTQNCFSNFIVESRFSSPSISRISQQLEPKVASLAFVSP